MIFLKAYYAVHILVAGRRDLSDQMLQITFVVVEGETKDSCI